MTKNAEAPKGFKLTITAQPGTEITLSFTTTPTGDVVSNMFFMCLCLHSPMHISEHGHGRSPCQGYQSHQFEGQCHNFKARCCYCCNPLDHPNPSCSTTLYDILLNHNTHCLTISL